MFTASFWKRCVIGSGLIVGIVLISAPGRSKDLSNSVSLPDGFDAPTPVRAIVQRACLNCHSNETVWPWYSKIPPVSWQIHDDVDQGREFMNLSRWGEYAPEERRGLASQMANATRAHFMPPSKYLWLHPEARLSDADLNALKEWAQSQGK